MKPLFNTVKTYLFIGIVVLLPYSCKVQTSNEAARLQKSILKEIPFQIDSIKTIAINKYEFTSNRHILYAPDTEIKKDGSLYVYRTTLTEPTQKQNDNDIWRNIIISPKQHLIICIDRFPFRQGQTKGFIYTLLMESKKFPTLGTYHWDVTDMRNLEHIASTLKEYRTESLNKFTEEIEIAQQQNFAKPESQSEYWAIIFHADSLYQAGNIKAAEAAYNRAFSVDKYILPSQLLTVARKMKAANNYPSAFKYVEKRTALEQDFYLSTSNEFPNLTALFTERAQKYKYDIARKERLEHIFETDQYYRKLWHLATQQIPFDSARVELLAQIAIAQDYKNMNDVSKELKQNGFPKVEEVGNFATSAIWLVFQHGSLEKQKEFLSIARVAVKQGNLKPMYLATLEDRINIREGKPQKYGTQRGPDGKLCPLLDKSKVDEWRKEVGLPPMKEMYKDYK